MRWRAGQGGLLKKSRATTMGETRSATYSSLAFHLSRLKNDPIRVSGSLPPSPPQFPVSPTSGDHFTTLAGLQSGFLSDGIGQRARAGGISMHEREARELLAAGRQKRVRNMETFDSPLPPTARI